MYFRLIIPLQNMLRNLIVLFIVISVTAGCRSQVPKEPDTTSTLPIPYPKHLIISDPATITVRWDPVTVSENNPILGFKIKVWEEQKETVHKYVDRDGEQLVLVKEQAPIKNSFHAQPAFVAVLPPDVFTATFHMKVSQDYELRGQTFNADGDGPLSSAYGFTIQVPEEDKKLEEKKLEDKDSNE